MKWPGKVITAIIAITILETIALLKGIDGATLGISFSAIAGLAGYTLGRTTSVTVSEKNTRGRLSRVEKRLKSK